MDLFIAVSSEADVLASASPSEMFLEQLFRECFSFWRQRNRLRLGLRVPFVREMAESAPRAPALDRIARARLAERAQMVVYFLEHGDLPADSEGPAACLDQLARAASSR